MPMAREIGVSKRLLLLNVCCFVGGRRPPVSRKTFFFPSLGPNLQVTRQTLMFLFANKLLFHHKRFPRMPLHSSAVSKAFGFPNVSNSIYIVITITRYAETRTSWIFRTLFTKSEQQAAKKKKSSCDVPLIPFRSGQTASATCECE